MHLKRLEIFGFKSFAQKTVLEFQKGISVIVGPNGCGKSNVFDAIRWVLGEQSVKELRGSSMEDVIFNGTDQKAPLGFAEVTLVFSNEKRLLATDYDEVMVTRRLFRSGESEYSLNKNVCRLKDVVELFLGTGVGAEAYSLVQQGKIDLVVSARPDDRREIFDEAAGITKYKSKKKEALSKLKETEDNLLRINDIVVEVKRQIASIERQAKKAQRYKEEFEILKGYELRFSRHQIGLLNQEYDKFSAELAACKAKELASGSQLEQLNNDIDSQSRQLEQIERGLGELKAKDIHLGNQVEAQSRQIIFNQERLQTMDEGLLRLAADKSASVGRCATHQMKIEEIKATLAALTQNGLELQSRLHHKKEELAILTHAVGGAKQSITQVETEMLDLQGSQVRFKNQLTENMRRTMEVLARKTRLEMENTKVNHEKSEVLQRLESMTLSILDLESRLRAQWADAEGARQSLEALEKQKAAQESLIDDLEKNHVFLLSQKEFIQKMHLQYQDIPDPVVEGQFVATVRPTEKQTGIIGKIKNVQVVPATATTPESYAITYATKYVELDLQYLDDRIAAIMPKLDLARVVQGEIDVKIQETSRHCESVLKNIQEQEKKLSVLEAQKNDFEHVSGKLIGELDVITVEFSEVESLIVDLKAKEHELARNLEGLSGQMARCQDDIKAKESAIAAHVKEREDLHVAMAQLETEIAAIADKHKALQEHLTVHVQNLDRDLVDIARFDEEARLLEAKKVKIADENIALQQDIEKLQQEKSSLQGVFAQVMAQKEQVADVVNALKNNIRGIEDEITKVKNQMHQYQMRQQELQFNQRAIKERLGQVYKIDEDQIQQQAPLTLEVNLEELSGEIEKLKKRCESYGAVNLVAIEEFEELKGRHEFLTKQQSDLLTAREQLMATIQKINRTTRQMFTDTFTRVNEEFKIYFRMLFGGGGAELVLLDPENALECGIDIVARPPGKKLQNISLLSGGEKTLTAIALIFGVFKVNPSPFCVLDEIDAALDESNVDRFANLLKDFAQIAQFVVITHNKNTMAVADIMYGVTMQEHGVSRIVSVKFDEYKAPPAKTPVVPSAMAAAV